MSQATHQVTPRKCSCGFTGDYREMVNHWWIYVESGDATYTLEYKNNGKSKRANGAS